MTHVADSNYKTALSGNFSGNNLKIIEENAKGRTAGIKLVYPGERQFFRVTAFDTDGAESRTGSAGASTFSPGVSLEKALTRISYSGIDIQYADIVFDLSGIEPELDLPRFHVRTIKSIDGVEMELPFPVMDSVPYRTITGNHVDQDGNVLGGSSTAYLMKSIDQWSDQEYQDFRIWATFADGRYYLHTDEIVSTGEVETYFEYQIPGQDAVRVPMVEGIQSTIWPGDHYDIVCLDFEEQEEEEQTFGTNPFETGDAVSMNTKWNLDTIEEFPFQPDAGSVYLGEAILGDTIEFTIKLNQTRYLNPDFGEPDITTEPGKRIYKAFSYDLDRPVVTKNFEIDEAVDFEISFGLGGQYKHWSNLVDPTLRSPSSIYNLDVSDRNWNYLDQEFTIRVPIPMDLDGVGPDGTVKVFIRPARNNAYRESVWPLPYTEVKQFRGTLLTAADEGATQVEVTDTVGTAYVNDTLYLDGYGYQISAVDTQADKTVLTLATALQSDNAAGNDAYINLHTPLAEPEIQFELAENFESDWNMVNQDSTTDNGDAYKPLTVMGQDPDTPANYLGYYNNQMETNWIGAQTYANPYWNQWADSANIDRLTQKGTDGSQANIDDNPLRLKNEFMGSEVVLGFSDEEGQADETWPQVTKFGDKLLSTWSSKSAGNWSIKGKIIDVSPSKEGNTIKEFDVTTDVMGSSYTDHYVFDNDQKALIIWNNLYSVKGLIIDLTAGSEGQALLPQSILIDDVYKGGSGLDRLYMNSELNITVYDDKALITWGRIPSSGYDLLGQFIDLSNSNLGAKSGSIFDISQGSSSSDFYHDIALVGSKALITWSRDVPPNSYNISAIFLDMNEGNLGQPITNILPVSSSNANQQYCANIEILDKKALIVWLSNHLNSSHNEIMGQFISTEEGKEGEHIGSEFQINSNASNNQTLPRTYSVQDKALVVWYSNHTAADQYSITGRLVDVRAGHEGETLGDDVVFSNPTYRNSNPVINGVGHSAVLTWFESKGSGLGYTKNAKLLEISKTDNVVYQGDIMVFDITNVPEYYTDKIAVSDQNAFLTWHKSGELGAEAKMQIINWRINERNLFKAPLLERDYEVKAQIVEELE